MRNEKWEKEYDVKVVRVERTCSKCEKGEMLPTNMVLTTYPAQYPHECNECGETEVFRCTYPKIEYRDRTLAEILNNNR